MKRSFLSADPAAKRPDRARRAAPVILALTLTLIGTGFALLAPGPYYVVTGPWPLPTIALAVAGGLIAARRPSHPIGWLFSAFGLLSGFGFVLLAFASESVSPVAGAWADSAANVATSVGVILLPAALLRFPDGLLPSRRWRWMARLIVLTMFVGATAALLNGGWGGDRAQAQFPSPLLESTAPWGDVASNLFYPLMGATMIGSAASLLVRYRQTRGVAREQLKWLAFAAAFLIFSFSVAFLVEGSAELSVPWAQWLVAAAFAAIPVAVVIAILRHRLFDIDRVINRTIVYGLATGGVLALYGVVVFSASSLAAETDNNLIVALATLIAAAAFRPALRRVQGFVDRRFYRRRLDVQRTIDRFGAQLSASYDLDQLTRDLVGVVRSTMQPEHVGVWLRSAETSR